MARSNPTRTPSGIMTFLGGLVLLALFALLIVWWIGSTGAPKDMNIEQKRAESRIDTRQKIDLKYSELLNSEGWVDKAKGVAHIQIGEAMKLTLAELKAKKVGPSTVKVEPPLVLPPPPPGEPAPAAMPSAPFGADTVRFEFLSKKAAAPAPSATLEGSAPAAAPGAPAPTASPSPAPAPAPAIPPAPAAPAPAAPAPAPATPPAASSAPAPPAAAPATPEQPAPNAPAPAPASPAPAPAPAAPEQPK